MDEVLKVSPLIESVKPLFLLSGKEGINDTLKYHLGGCDLGFPIYNKTNKTLYLAFGDSFLANDFSEEWRSNIIAVVKDFNAPEKIKICDYIKDGSGKARAIIDGHHVDMLEMTKIPTGGIEINGVMYLFHFSIRSWNIKNPCCLMNFGGLIKSKDNGVTWERIPDVVWVNHSSGDHADEIQKLINEDIHQVANVYDIDLKYHEGFYFTQAYPKDGGDGYIYVFGEGGFRSSGMKLARVRPENIEKFDEYEYLVKYDTGNQPVFVKGIQGLRALQDNPGSFVLNEKSGECSLIYNKYLKKWMFFKISEDDPSAVFYLADKITGPYVDKHIMFVKSDPLFARSSMYAPMTHEVLTKENGRIIYFLLSQWIPVYNPLIVELKLKENL